MALTLESIHPLSPRELPGVPVDVVKQECQSRRHVWRSPGQQCFPKATHLSSFEKKNSFLRFDEYEYFACVYVCGLCLSVPYVSGAREGQKGAFDFTDGREPPCRCYNSCPVLLAAESSLQHCLSSFLNIKVISENVQK